MSMMSCQKLAFSCSVVGTSSNVKRTIVAQPQPNTLNAGIFVDMRDNQMVLEREIAELQSMLLDGSASQRTAMTTAIQAMRDQIQAINCINATLNLGDACCSVLYDIIRRAAVRCVRVSTLESDAALDRLSNRFFDLLAPEIFNHDPNAVAVSLSSDCVYRIVSDSVETVVERGVFVEGLFPSSCTTSMVENVSFSAMKTMIMNDKSHAYYRFQSVNEPSFYNKNDVDVAVILCVPKFQLTTEPTGVITVCVREMSCIYIMFS